MMYSYIDLEMELSVQVEVEETDRLLQRFMDRIWTHLPTISTGDRGTPQ